MSTDRTLERASQGIGKKPALIVVDVIKGFTDVDCPLGSEAGEVVAANCRLMDLFHEREWPVALTSVVYRHDHEATVFRARLPALNLLTPDQPWIQFDERLPVTHRDWRFEKHHASAFHGTNLDEQLQMEGVDSVIVTGLTTSGCVRATAVDALQNNYRVIVPREAVGDRDAAAHEANLFDLNAKYADVMSLEQVLALLSELTD